MVGSSQVGQKCTLVFVSKGLHKFKGQMAEKIWVVFAGWARVIDRFD
jgi:hypothetical protein